MKLLIKIRKPLLLSGLYCAQGLPYGFFTQALPALLREAHVSLPAIGLAHLLTVPWALKFILAPAVDRWHFPGLGLRRSWLIPLQLCSVILFSLLALATPGENLTWVLLAYLLANSVAAAQDVATDGLAVDILKENERGWANGIQVAAYRIGMIAGGGALLIIYHALQWQGIMLVMAGLLFLCTLPVLLYREEPKPLRPKAKNISSLTTEVFHFLSRPGAKMWAAVLFFYKCGHAAAVAMLRPWLVDHKYSIADIGWILGTYGFIAGFLGAVAGGFFASRFDRKKLLIIFGLLEAIAVSTYLWPLSGEPSTFKIAFATAVDHFGSGLATVTLFTLMMDACTKERAASDYTIQACIVVIATGLASTVSGVSAEVFGYGLHFAISAALSIFAVLFAYLALKQAAVRELFRANVN